MWSVKTSIYSQVKGLPLICINKFAAVAPIDRRTQSARSACFRCCVCGSRPAETSKVRQCFFRCCTHGNPRAGAASRAWVRCKAGFRRRSAQHREWQILMVVIGGCSCRELGCSAAESVLQRVRLDDAVARCACCRKVQGRAWPQPAVDESCSCTNLRSKRMNSCCSSVSSGASMRWRKS